MANVAQVFEDFSGSGALGGSNVGASSLPWQISQGNWTRSNGYADTSTAASSNPIAIADMSWPDADVSMNCYSAFGGGDCLYFRVLDKDNWWRLRTRTHRTSNGYYTYGSWYGTGWDQVGHVAFASGYHSGTDYSNYEHGIPTSKRVYAEYNAGGNVTAYDYYAQDVDRHVYYHTSYSDYRYIVLEKMANGALIQIDEYYVDDFDRLRVNVNANTITYYEPDGQAAHATITDNFNELITKFGIGRGDEGDNQYDQSAIDNFSVSLINPYSPPTFLKPENNSDVDITIDDQILVANHFSASTWASTDFRYKVDGDINWTVASDVPMFLSVITTFQSVLGAVTPPMNVEMQVRATDSLNNTTDWSASLHVSLLDRPIAPVFISPVAGSDVFKNAIATVNFDNDSEDATEMEAQRVGYNQMDGTVDPSSIYDPDVHISVDPDTPYSLLSSTMSTHQTGDEFIRVRRRTSAGGNLWSEWASLHIVMQLLPPYPPTVSYVALPDEAMVHFDVSFQDADATHDNVFQLEIVRNGEPIISKGVIDNGDVSWDDKIAKLSADYEFTAIAFSGGTATRR